MRGSRILKQILTFRNLPIQSRLPNASTFLTMPIIPPMVSATTAVMLSGGTLWIWTHSSPLDSGAHLFCPFPVRSATSTISLLKVHGWSASSTLCRSLIPANRAKNLRSPMSRIDTPSCPLHSDEKQSMNASLHTSLDVSTSAIRMNWNPNRVRLPFCRF
ncbi:hypothetical protein FF2_018786 [Malus domestica]